MGKGFCRFVRWPSCKFNIERFDAREFWPMPPLGAKSPALGGEKSTLNALDFRDIRLDAKASTDSTTEVVLGFFERRTERAAVLERMGHVAQVRLGGVVHESSEGVFDVAATLLDQIGQDHRVLCNRVKDATVTAEPALVSERTSDVSGIKLVGIRIERVDPAARDGLQKRARNGRAIVADSRFRPGSC
jgi:hypothetical protein